MIKNAMVGWQRVMIGDLVEGDDQEICERQCFPISKF
jgi:hypothetical protein